ncbi:beta-lactamase family protein [Geomonas sp. RF6]|uniref:serine hydrolase domain-containing protein n=1 Tax=Geomonas sp. RF6 TaxID=2897342 RepID=UPI001E2D383F|nr:serine hydrolase domain-containing protein [Geomonas sp. RF6]UFS69883.1 beta-lactamase family protein [Geomonas sp. RF6]
MTGRTIFSRATSLLVAPLLVIGLCFPASSRAGDPLPTASPDAVGLSPQRLGQLDAMLKRAVDEGKVAGGIVLIARHGKIAYFNNFGRADSDRAMRKDTIFRIASMTKPLTAAAIMMLNEEGRILLSDPVSKYIPEFKNPKVMVAPPKGSKLPYRLVPAKREITIRDLLTHTAGLSYRFLANWLPDARHKGLAELYSEAGISDGLSETEGTMGEMVKTLGRLPLMAHPGESYDYSLSYDVLGYVVEVVSGMTLPEFLEERLFKPLKMTDTSFFLPPEKRERLSALWESRDGKVTPFSDGVKQDGNYYFSASFPYSGPRTYNSGGAGVLSTAADYFRFCQMLLNKGELDGVRVLGRKTVEWMTATNHIGDLDETLLHGKGWKFGLGFAIETERGHDVDAGSVGVFEWAGIFSTRFGVDPKEEKITIYLTQTNPFSMHIELWDKVNAFSAAAVVD